MLLLLLVLLLMLRHLHLRKLRAHQLRLVCLLVSDPLLLLMLLVLLLLLQQMLLVLLDVLVGMRVGLQLRNLLWRKSIVTKVSLLSCEHRLLSLL